MPVVCFRLCRRVDRFEPGLKALDPKTDRDRKTCSANPRFMRVCGFPGWRRQRVFFDAEFLRACAVYCGRPAEAPVRYTL